jgi:outer membrane lipoprotein-sorting protein
MNRKLLACLVLMIGGVQCAAAQSITAAQILQNMKHQFEPVKDYTVTLKATVNMERMQIPEMIVTLYFKQPDKVHIESKNFAMLPKDAIALNPAQLIDKFDASIVGTEQKDNTTMYKLRLISKPEKGKPVHESYVWMDASRWVVTHFESTPSDVRKISVDLAYETIDGKYTLPSKIAARMDAQQPPDSSAEKMYSPQRMPRKGNVTILYSDYKVNTGLSDEIFDKKKEEKKK